MRRSTLADGRVALVTFTDRATGDLSVDGDPTALAATRRSVVDLPWTSLRQVHGARVVEVVHPGDAAGEHADAAVTTTTGAVLAVQAADCAPLALVHPAGGIGVVHAGWRGLLAGVIDEAVGRLRGLCGPGAIEGYLGPCIHAECYEFSDVDLAPIVDRFGDAARGRTAGGRTALDVPAAVAAACRAADIELDLGAAVCTSCAADRCYSYRARRETGRHAVVAWIEPS
jgi:copper oxidase (laccase) domain-containing protein